MKTNWLKTYFESKRLFWHFKKSLECYENMKMLKQLQLSVLFSQAFSSSLYEILLHYKIERLQRYWSFWIFM